MRTILDEILSGSGPGAASAQAWPYQNRAPGCGCASGRERSRHPRGCRCARCRTQASWQSEAADYEYETPAGSAAAAPATFQEKSCSVAAKTTEKYCKSAQSCPAIPNLVCMRGIYNIPFIYPHQFGRDRVSKLDIITKPEVQRKQEFVPEVKNALMKFVDAMRANGMPIEGIVTYGSLYCRCIKHSNTLSNHSFGRAIDIVGVRWAKSSGIQSPNNETLLTETNRKNPVQAALLARINACLHLAFPQVLDYNYNADHQDHFHCELRDGGMNVRGGATIGFVQEALSWIEKKEYAQTKKLDTATLRGLARVLGASQINEKDTALLRQVYYRIFTYLASGKAFGVSNASSPAPSTPSPTAPWPAPATPAAAPTGLPGLQSKCPDSPGKWARDYFKGKLWPWWNDQNLRRGSAPESIPIGTNIRNMTPRVFPGVPPEVIFGFCANASFRENTTDGTGVKFHEIGLFGTEAGPRNGPAPNPDPRAADNSWGALHNNPAVLQLLGRPATMTHNAWKNAAADQVAVGLVNIRKHGEKVSRLLDPAIRPDLSKPKLSIFSIACAFMGWSAGDSRAARHLNRFKDVLARVPEEQRWGLFLKTLADGIQAGKINLSGLRKHNSPAYSALRTWQKITGGQALAAQTKGNLAWFATGLGAAEEGVADVITCAGKRAKP